METSHFVLDDSGGFLLASVANIHPRWQEIPHARQRTRAFILLAGESLTCPWMIAAKEVSLHLEVLRGLPEISSDGLDLEVAVETEGEALVPLFSCRLENRSPGDGSVGYVVRLPLATGSRYRLHVRCGAGPEGDPCADWLAIASFVVGPPDSLGRLRARSNHEWRLANEIAHFEGVYDRSFYSDRQVEREAGSVGPIRMLSSFGAPPDRRHAPRGGGYAHEPWANENAFSFAHRQLTALLPVRPPDFAASLRAISQRCDGRPVRVLSLCAGQAAIEGALFETAAVPVSLCLLDVNQGLLEAASRRMPSNVSVSRVLGDANGFAGQLGQFDVVNITSGLHHLVELESVLSGIASSLGPGGEFWLIGEQVGRNGNRLWPDALATANRIFQRWPEEKRRSAYSGRVDDELPDVDYSAGCFEGIRSEEILGLLQRHFLPVDVYLRNCFLWRLFDVAYSSNFDTGAPDDRALIDEAVRSEVAYWEQGGQGTELHAIYRSKLGDTPSFLGIAQKDDALPSGSG